MLTENKSARYFKLSMLGKPRLVSHFETAVLLTNIFSASSSCVKLLLTLRFFNFSPKFIDLISSLICDAIISRRKEKVTTLSVTYAYKAPLAYLLYLSLGSAKLSFYEASLHNAMLWINTLTLFTCPENIRNNLIAISNKAVTTCKSSLKAMQ